MTVQAQQSEDYRTGVRYVMRFVILQALVALALTALLIYVTMTTDRSDRYFAMTGEGLRMRLVPLEQPNLNQQAVTAWAAQVATDMFTFGFNDYNERLNKLRVNFTDDGWKKFREAVINSEILKSVESQQQILTAIVREPPRVLYEGLIEGDYGWMVEVSVVMTTRAGGVRKVDKLRGLITIVRMPTAQNPMGMGIKSLRIR